MPIFDFRKHFRTLERTSNESGFESATSRLVDCDLTHSGAILAGARHPESRNARKKVQKTNRVQLSTCDSTVNITVMSLPHLVLGNDTQFVLTSLIHLLSCVNAPSTLKRGVYQVASVKKRWKKCEKCEATENVCCLVRVVILFVPISLRKNAKAVLSRLAVFATEKTKTFHSFFWQNGKV